MAMAHQPLAAILGVRVGVAAEEGCDLRLDGLRQQGSRALAQNFGQRIGELGWLDQLDDSILDHGVSLLRWRSGGLEHPHDTPPHPSRRHQLPRIPHGDAIADIACRVRFSPFEGGAQTAIVRRIDGPQAAGTGDGGQAIVEGAPVSMGRVARVTEAGDAGARYPRKRSFSSARSEMATTRASRRTMPVSS